jgi:2-dehydro-3-deoxy-D-arabinonate dehydratase
MFLTKHETPEGPRWAFAGRFLTGRLDLGLLLALPREGIAEFLASSSQGPPASGRVLAPLEPDHEVWAAGDTYASGREDLVSESAVEDIYARVCAAERPEIFFKAIGRRVVGHEGPIRIRQDSTWNVPEPELVLVLNAEREIVGFTAGNDVTSRDLESENPLYVPQAKSYDGSCALGPAIQLGHPDEFRELRIELTVTRAREQVLRGETNTSRLKRRFEELVHYLMLELDFPRGAFLFTGAGIVPPEDFSLEPGDRVAINVGELTLVNDVASGVRPRVV